MSVAKIDGQAVVLGASMSGLLAARVLSDFYQTVTVVERDVLPTDDANRRGVPQGQHAHALWARGSQILEEFFPGLLTQMVADGCTEWNDGDFSTLCLTLGGHQFVRSGRFPDFDPSDAVYYATRPFVEGHCRRRVAAIPNVTLLDGHDVERLISDTFGANITGVAVTSRSTLEKRYLTADLVVDATGRGSRTPAFLEDLGYGRPFEDEVVMRLSYTSQLLRIPDATLKEKLVLVGQVPQRPTGMALIANENNTWMLTAFGMVGHEPPADYAGMLRYMEDFTPAHVMSALWSAEPLREVAQYRTPSSRWRRYDKMRRFPAGLVVFGDAIASFDPIYGQGMTVAALQAVALEHCLRQGPDDLAARYFRAAAKPIGVAWKLAVGGDLAVPEVEGPRSLSTRLTNKYVDMVQSAAETNTVVARRFLRVAGFHDSPASLMFPSFALRVAATNCRYVLSGRRRAVAAKAPTTSRVG